MRRSVKKILAVMALGVMASMTALPAMADWGYYHHYHHHYHPYYHHHYYHDGGDDLAAGLVVGGVVGLLAGSAMANSNQSYSYPAQSYCHQEREAVWNHQFCDDNGCFMKTKWRTYTVCN